LTDSNDALESSGNQWSLFSGMPTLPASWRAELEPEKPAPITSLSLAAAEKPFSIPEKSVELPTIKPRVASASDEVKEVAPAPAVMSESFSTHF
jgi:hypothetical protein